MALTKPKLNKDEFARRGDEIYESVIGAKAEQAHVGEFVAIDINSGAYEIDAKEMDASDRLTARLPDAQIWIRRVGSRFVRRL